MKIFASLQNMSQSEWINHVPSDAMEDAKKKGDAFEVYGIAHPGESDSTLVVDGKKESVVLKWFGQILNFIKEKIPRGTPAYYLHNTDNSHDGRVKIGEVVSTFMNKTTEKVYAIIRRYKDYIPMVKTTVASFEAPLLNLEKIAVRGGNVEPGDMGEITAIALANGEIEKPAFAGAIREAYLQCLKKENNMPRSLSEIIDELRNHEEFNTVNPFEIFEEEKIMELEPIAAKLNSKDKGGLNLYHQVNRLKTEKLEMLKALNQTKDELQKTQLEVLGFNVRDKFSENMAKRNGLTGPQKEYIDVQRQYLKVESGKDIDQQINSFLDKTIEDSKRFIPQDAPQSADNKSQLPSPDGLPSSEAANYLPK